MAGSFTQLRSHDTTFNLALLPPQERKELPKPDATFTFGSIVTDHMLVCDYLSQKGGWQTPQIEPFAPFSMRPDSLVFHYGQQIFEGLKAYEDAAHLDEILLFRPEMNARRFFHSALRLGMQPVPENLFLAAVKTLVAIESRWLLQRPASLYIRPFLIPLDYGVSYRAAQDYRFCIILSPAKNYFGKDKGVSVAVERHHVRAVRGGVGETKCGGNYAASVAALSEAKAKGADQVLWLDALEMRYVEEVGAMNIMFFRDGVLLTPPLSGSILPGVTRTSVIEWCLHAGIKVSEERLAIDRCLDDIAAGRITEVFGCGTAAVISPVTTIISGEKTYQVGDGTPGRLTNQLRDTLEAIQFGQAPDPKGWVTRVKKQNL